MFSRTDQNNAFFRQLLFLGVLVTIGLILLRQLDFFVGAFLGAITIYVVLRGWLFRLTEQRRWKPGLAAMTLVTATSVMLLGLGYLIFEVIASEVTDIDTSKIIEGFNGTIAQINDWVGYRVVSGKLLEESKDFITKFASMLINTTYSFVANIFLMVVILYFMLAGGRKMERTLLRYAPFRGKRLGVVKEEIRSMIFSNAVGIPVVMIAQSVTAGLVYWLLGLENVLFWAFLTAIFGLIPMVGTALVSVPLGVYLMAGGDVWQGVVMISAGLLVIANADNVCRIVLMKRVANTHPLIVIFGVMLGIPLFGFWGIIFGPLLISGFLLLVKIYYAEYKLSTPSGPRHKEGT